MTILESPHCIGKFEGSIKSVIDKLNKLQILLKEDSFEFDRENIALQTINQQIDHLIQNQQRNREKLVEQANELERKTISLAKLIDFEITVDLLDGLVFNLPLERIDFWTLELSKVEEKVNKRKSEIEAIQKEIISHKSELKDLKDVEFKQNDLTTVYLNSLKQNLLEIKKEKINRIQKIQSIQNTIQNWYKKLDISKESIAQLLKERGLDPELTDHYTTKLESFATYLSEVYNSKSGLVQGLIKEIRNYWKNLGMEEKELSSDIKNIEQYQKMSLVLQNKYTEEMSDYCKNILEEIKIYWSKCYKNAEYQEQFIKETFEININTKNRLDLELAQLKEIFTYGREIFDFIYQRKLLLEKIQVFQIKATDPKRLFRSSFQLLEEEKFRKNALDDLLGIEAHIKDLIILFEEQVDVKFTFMGVDYLSELENDQKCRYIKESIFPRKPISIKNCNESMSSPSPRKKTSSARPVKTPSKSNISGRCSTPVK